MKAHLAVSVKDIEESVAEYTRLLGQGPDLVVPGAYALWRTPALNMSIRKTGEGAGTVRHVGFERDDAERFTEYRDCNGLLWEDFNKHHQAEEIKSVWKDTEYIPK
jgi:catechol 2,3-dioxygenase-like lactoylglutathione lyase family enzyme